ncbi:MAG: peptidyl-prolyl cis-trans isomerase [Chlorobi bacterium]|nr:MAG: hypothetical protein F9K28_10660 [Bacteroidota bacterium]MBE2264893.1 SurA N-terminal domain-containing protein [Flavobacteriales bacterium]MBL1161030.1 peptidyl-prolyl cis-trans isomerase [Chlorobiota bacterium]MBZ0194874.1 SurA N-terminal domain-containing protein [Candidatus Kapabacteria bacterium]MCC6331850.1 SurA N-terminal domain-containing protein [Ignavibacteria bacterium]
MLLLLFLLLQTSTPEVPVAGIVNGDTILLETYAREIGRKSELYSMTHSTSASIMQDTWNALVQTELIRQKTNELGIAVSSAQVDSVLLNATPDYVKRGFTDNKGRFDKKLLEAMLYRPDSLVRAQNPKLKNITSAVASVTSTMHELRSRLADVLRMNALRAYREAITPLDTAALAELYKQAAYQAEADVYFLPCKDVRYTPTDAEIHDWYQRHTADYVSDVPLRRFAALRWETVASHLDSSMVLRDMLSFVAAVNGEHNTEKRDSIWDGIAQQVKHTSTILSADSVSQREFYKAVASTRNGRPGTCVGPILNPQGYHIILVDSVLRRQDKTSPDYAIRILVAPVEPGAETTDSVFADVRQAANMYSNGTPIDEIEARFNKKITMSPWVTSTDKVFGSYRVVQAAFEVPVGGLAPPVDTPDSGVVLVIAADSLPAGLLTLDAARSRIVEDIIRNKACSHLEPRARTMYGLCKALPDGRMFIAEQLPTTSVWRDQTIDATGFVGPEVYDPTASLAIRRATSAGMMGPFRGDAGWYVVNIINTKTTDLPPFSEWLQAEGDLYVQRQREQQWSDFLTHITRTADIRDFRWVYFRY